MPKNIVFGTPAIASTRVPKLSNAYPIRRRVPPITGPIEQGMRVQKPPKARIPVLPRY